MSRDNDEQGEGGGSLLDKFKVGFVERRLEPRGNR
jgi:hypothetical protein